MFDLRYHVASLAAVFLALAVGIILGVAISGKVRGAEDALNAQRAGELEAQLRLRNENAARADELETYVERTYGPLVSDRLAGKSIAVVLVGPLGEDVRSAIDATLRDASGVSARTVSLEVPLDPGRLKDLLASQEDVAAFADDFRALGEAVGRELAEGIGEDPLLPHVAAELITEQDGSTTIEVTGVVVARAWRPSTGQSEAVREATQEYLDGLMRGLQSTGGPVVGVAFTVDEDLPALLDWYKSTGVSTVDHLDETSGRLALALLLDGAAPGSYGFTEGHSDDGPIPRVPTVASVE